MNHEPSRHRAPRQPSLSAWVVGLILALGIAGCGTESPLAPLPCDGADTCEQPPVQDTRDTGMYTRVALLSDGTLVAVSRDAARKVVAVTHFDAEGRVNGRHSLGGWTATGQTAHPDSGGDGGWWPTLAIDARDGVHVAWHEATRGSLLYSQGSIAVGFSAPEIVDGDGPEVTGTHADMAIDEQGSVHIAYRSETRRSLRYAHRDPSGAWRVEDVPVCAGETPCPITTAEDYGSYASIALTLETGGGTAPRIAFFDALRGDLKLAARNTATLEVQSAWQVTTLDGRNLERDSDTGRVGRFASLAVTPARNLVAAYFDDDRGTLRFLSRGAAPRVVDQGDYTTADGRRLTAHVGQFARVRVDAAGAHHIIYLDATRLVWKYLRIEGETIVERSDLDGFSPGGWLDFVPTDAGLVGAYGALSGEGELRTELKWFQL